MNEVEGFRKVGSYLTKIADKIDEYTAETDGPIFENCTFHSPEQQKEIVQFRMMEMDAVASKARTAELEALQWKIGQYGILRTLARIMYEENIDTSFLGEK